MRFEVAAVNRIGADRAAIVLRDESRLMNYYAHGVVARADDRTLTWDGRTLPVPFQPRAARVVVDGEHIRLTVQFDPVRWVLANRSRSALQADLTGWLDDRFSRTYQSFPAKVFGIGFHRTGTSSLIAALRLLGYFSNHNPAWLVPSMQTGNADLSIVDDYQALADNPIPLLYRELDERYPGSKFVLTERPTDLWLPSVQRLIEQWGRDPELTRLIYGTDEFEPQIYRRRYLDHSRAVREYFRGRPESFLVLDVSEPDGFLRLGNFLGVEPPESLFPRSETSY